MALLACGGSATYVCMGHMQKTCCVKRSNSRNRFMIKDRIIYEWDQTPNTITMYLKAPGGLSKHNIEVLVWPKRIQIDVRGNPPFLKEELFAAVDAEASAWSISRKGELQIRLS